MPFDRTGSQPFEFDPAKLNTVQPVLAEAEGYALSPKELASVFGIQAQYFGKLPKRMVVPVLTGRWYVDKWYHTTGYLYVLEPVAWVAQVSHTETLPASAFKTTTTRKTETISQTKFNAGTSAEVNFEGGGTYLGVTASVKSSSNISFEYSHSTTTEEHSETEGVSGKQPIHKLFVYPTLKCKVIRKQRIDYTANDSSEELKWSPKSYTSGYWGERWVDDNRVEEIRKLQLHPVPMDGEGLGNKTYILPVPEVTANGDLEVTTIISRQGWKDWYVYDLPWGSSDQTSTLAAPNNTVAFQPMYTWATLVSSFFASNVLRHVNINGFPVNLSVTTWMGTSYGTLVMGHSLGYTR